MSPLKVSERTNELRSVGVEPAARRDPTFLPLFRGACRPDRAECEGNPRARSARLRAAERTAAAAWNGTTADASANRMEETA